MSLRYRTIFILGLLLLVLAGLSSALFYHFGTDQFYGVEQRVTEHLADQSLAIVRDELAALDLLTRDWATWDDTYTFIEDLNPAYIRSNIVDETFTNAHLNLMLFVRTSGEVAFARAYDLEAGEEMPIPQGVYDALPILTRALSPGTGRQGVLLLPEGVLLVTARPILTNQGEGPSRGTLVFGRFLSDDIVAKINAHLGASAAIYRWDRPEDWPADLRQVSAALSPAQPLLARPLNEDQIAGYALLTDLYGNPALVLTVVEEREIYHQFRFALRLFIANVALMGLLFAGVVLLLLDHLVLRRLTALITEVRAIGARGNSGRAVTVRGGDELAGLAEAINDMLAAIEQAHREREEQEARLSRLAENSPDVIYRLAFSPPRLEYVSPAIARLLGYPPEDFYTYPRLIFRLVHPEDRPLLQAALQAELPPEEPLILRWINRKGETVWAEHRHTVIRDSEGRAVAVEGIARDVTEQKRAETEIAQLNAVLRAVRNVNQIISREKDRQKLLQSVCEELVNTRGYTAAWIVLTDGAPHIAAAAGAILRAPSDLLRRWEEDIFPLHARWVYDRPDALVMKAGDACPLLHQDPPSNGILVRIAHAGRIYGILCAALPATQEFYLEEQSLFAEVASDIAFALHSLEQEEARRESEERFQLLAESALAGVYLTQDGLLRYVNPAAAQMFGYTPEEIIDRLTPLDVVASEDRERVREYIRQRMNGETVSVHYQFHGLRKDGSTFDCEVLGTVVNYRGRTAILGTILDITERTRAEEAIRRQVAQRETLYQIATELTAELDLEILLRSIVQRALELVGGNAGGLYLYRSEADLLEWAISVGPHLPPLGTTLRRGEGGLSCRVWETGQPCWVDDYRHWEGQSPKYAGYPWTAVIGVPVRWREEFLGVLILCADPPRTFSQEDADLLTLFAAQAAVSIINARLFAVAERERTRLDFLHRLSQRLGGSLDAFTVAQEALDALCRTVDAQKGVIYLYEPPDDRLRLIAISGFGEETAEAFDRRLQLRLGQGLAGWVALHRQTAMVDDILQDERWLPVPGMDDEARAAISTPILVRGELIGIITVHSKKPAAFTPEDGQLMEAAASVIGTALLNARLYADAQERARRLALVNQVATGLSDLQDPDAVCRQIVERIAHAFAYDYVGLMLMDDARGDLVFVAGAGIWADLTPKGFRQKLSEGMIGWVARHGETLLANDVSREPRYIAPYLTETRAELDVPLRYHGKLIGVLTVQSRRRNAFTPLDVMSLEALADDLAAAITNARLYQARQQQVRELTVLHQAALTVSSQETLDSMLEALAGQMGQALDVTSVYISLWDEKTHAATELIGWFGPEASEQERAAIATDLSRHPTVVSALRERRPTVLRASGSLSAGDRAEVEQYGWKSQFIVPLVVHEHSIGFVVLSESRREREFTEAEIRFCQTLAADAAAAIERARLCEQEQRARERTEALYRIGQIVNSTLDPDAILDRLTEEAMRATGATHGSVLVPDPERGIFERRSLRGYSSQERERAQSQPLSLTEGIHSRAYRTCMTYYVPDVRQDPDYFPLIPTTRSELVIPLLRGDRILGNLDLQSPQVDAFRDVDMEFLRALTDQVAIALENARLYQEEQRRSQEQEILALIATALNTLEVRLAFPFLASSLRTLTGCDRVAVALLDDTRTRYRIEVLETPFPVLEVGTVLPLSATPVWEDILAGNPHFCPDMGAEVDYEAIRALYDAGFRSYVSLPLRVGGRVIGALHVVSLRVRHFRQAQVRLLQQVADALAAAIENERLYRAEQEQRMLAEALAQAAIVVSSTLDPGETMGRILEQVARVVPGDAFNIMLVENGNAHVLYWKGYEQFGVEGRIAFLTLPIADTPNLRRMAETGEPLLIPDTDADPDWRRLEGWEWLRAYVGAPIVAKGVVVGFLNVDGVRPHQFTPADAARLALLATHVATALENARLYRELQDYARTLEERVRERTALLAAQYARMEAILHSTGDGIILTDAQGEVLQDNPVVQRWLAQDLASEDARKLQEAIRQIARRAQEQPREIVELSGLDLEVRASPVQEPEGEGAAVVILHDVTQFKALERLRTRFISNISHELRTPLTTIKTYLHILRGMPELLPKYLDILEREADWQARLVENVLEISRLDSGAFQIHFSPVGLNALVAEVIDAQQPLALAQGLVLECHLAEKEPVAHADPDALRMVLINLIHNSIQYTPSGGRVEVTTGEEEQEGRRWATVTVADTGIGIPPKELPYIFERFFRGERPRQMQIPGTGLGLSIVKEIVDRHHGRMTVESEEGKGTRFTLWLPVAEERLLTKDDKK
ncbi:MAG: GAF domain-containing protein [Anaerolineae bacterium]